MVYAGILKFYFPAKWLIDGEGLCALSTTYTSRKIPFLPVGINPTMSVLNLFCTYELH